MFIFRHLSENYFNSKSFYKKVYSIIYIHIKKTVVQTGAESAIFLITD